MTNRDLTEAAEIRNSTTQLLWIGTTTSESAATGIYSVDQDVESGRLIDLRLTVACEDPTWILRDPLQSALFTVSERPECGQVVRWVVNGHQLNMPQSHSSEGGLPCHLAFVDRDLWVANYEDGRVLRVAINSDGGFGETSVQQHRGDSIHERQRGPHAHCSVRAPDGDGVLVADLGSDAIWRHRHDQWAVDAVLPPGAGPRTLAVRGASLFVCGELNNRLYEIRDRKVVAELALLEDGNAGGSQRTGVESAAAQVTLHPDGNRLFVSNRGADTITVVDVQRAADPQYLTQWPCGGQHPRHFAFSAGGRWLVVANRDSGNLVVLDATSGEIVSECAAPGPTCVAPEPI